MLYVVIVAVVFIIAISFSFGWMIADFTTIRIAAKANPDLNDCYKKYLKEFKSNIVLGVFTLFITLGFFAFSIVSYREKELIKLKTGEIQCEEVITTYNHINEEPKVDTTYRFYKVKNKD